MDGHDFAVVEEEAELTSYVGVQLRGCIANLRSELKKARTVITRLKELLLNAYALEGMLQEILDNNGGQ
jgi:hypothetical protein